jgi:prevent-host-death family protein
MVMNKTSIADVKARLSEYLERVEKGERIVICRHNKPVAELGPVENIRTEPRPIGPLSGRPAFTVGEAFFEPLSAVELDAWEGGALPSLGARQPSGAVRASRVAERKASYGKTTSPTPRTSRRRP